MNKGELIPYEYDASRIKGLARSVFFPKTINEVKEIILNEKRLCIRGGGSGLVGGCIPENFQDSVLDLSKLNKIEEVDLERFTVEVEGGVILDDLSEYLKDFNLEFPIDIFSREVCTIGGMIATNAVGSRTLKYKDVFNWIRWIDVIDCEGNINRKGKTEISDYCGMEGITGVIVRACLNLSEIKKRSATVVKVEEKEKIIEIVKHLRKDVSVSMIDFIDKKISKGIGLSDCYHLIVEYENSSGILNEKEYEEIMKKKELIFSYLVNEGYNRIEDVKINIEQFDKIFEWLEYRKIPIFGHLSVGIIQPCFFKGQEDSINELMRIIKISGGRVSSKYGFGVLKKEFIDVNDKKILINIKKRTDYKNKFNLGKVL